MTQYIQRPLIPLAAAAFLGCLAGSSLPLGRPLFWLLTGALLLPASFFTRKRGAGFPWLLLAAFLIFCGLAIRAGFIQPDDISCWAPRRDILLQGTLADIPRSSPDIPRWSATLVCSSAEWHGQRGQTSGRVQVSFPGFAPAWNPGDLIQVQGKLFLPAEPANPGEFNYVAFLDAKGVRACLSSVFPGDAIRLRTASYGHWGRVAGGLYRWLSQEIRKSTPPWAAGWVNGLVTGDRSGINAWAGERLAAAGLAHLLAVSGMNVSIIFVTLLSIGAFLRVPRSLALGPALAGILLLVLCTGGQPPVVRAAWMTLCIAACYFAGRAPDSLSGLSFSAIVILACDPLACRDAGFQLSYTATIAILVVLPIFHAMPRLCFGFRWLLESLLISTAALLLTLPLTLYYFYSAVPVALLTNLAAVPILDIVVISGLLAGLLHGLLPFMATLSGWIAGQAVGLLEAITRLALRIPAGRIFIYPPPVWWVVGFYMALGLLAWKPARGLGLAAVGIALLIYPLYQPASPPPRVWRVTFLSLNIGEATLVESPSGSRLLLDTGTEEEFLRRVKPCLASRGINQLDGMLLSHLDADHSGGAVACLSCFQVRTLLTPAFLPEDQKPASAIKDATRIKGTQLLWLVRGETWNLDQDIRLEVLWPPAEDTGPRNLRCLVVRVSGPGGRLLFTGDSPGEVECQWIDPDCDVLKAGHHGGRTSSHPDFLGRIHPQWSVIMPGNHNPFGFPNPATLARLQTVSEGVLSTQNHGAIELTLSPGKPIRWRWWN